MNVCMIVLLVTSESTFFFSAGHLSTNVAI